MVSAPYTMLHAVFLENLIVSVAFLVPLLVTLWLKKRASSGTISNSLNYVAVGFLVGFLSKLLSGFVKAYVIQLPILPLKLHEGGLPSEVIGRVLAHYNLAFLCTDTVLLFVSLLLVVYGVYRLTTSVVGK